MPIPYSVVEAYARRRRLGFVFIALVMAFDAAWLAETAKEKKADGNGAKRTRPPRKATSLPRAQAGNRH